MAIKIGKRSTGNGNSLFTGLILVKSAEINQETGQHIVEGETTGGKAIRVTMMPKEAERDGKKVMDGFCKSRELKYQSVQEDGSVLTEAKKQRLGEGGMLQVMRGEWGAKEGGVSTVVVGENSHYKTQFYNADDLARRGKEADFISASTYSANLFNKGSAVEPVELLDVVQDKLQKHLDSVSNPVPVVAVLPINEQGEVCGDETLVYVPTWNTEEKRNLTLEESLTGFAGSLEEELEDGVAYQYIVGDQVRFNSGLDRRAQIEMTTNRILNIEVDGEEMSANVSYGRPGVANIKFSETEDDLGNTRQFNSVTTIAYTGKSDLLVEGLARINDIPVNAEYLAATHEQLDAFVEQDKASRAAQREAKAQAEAQKTASASAAMDDEPGM